MRATLTLLFILHSLFCISQFEIKGRLQSTNGDLKSFQVKLFRESNPFHTTITDTSGRFSFQLKEPGVFEVSVQSVFYNDTTIRQLVISEEKKLIDLGTITLEPLSKTLATIMVKGTKPLIEFKEDHLAFTPAADPAIGSRPVAEILNYIPGLSVDGKNITAKGNESMQLLVNGRQVKTPALDYLSQLSADEVERIEIYDNATRFSYVKSAIVMNVVLKRRDQKKLWNAGLNSNTLPKINPYFDLSFSSQRQKVYARLSHDIAIMRSSGYHKRESDVIRFYQDFNNRLRHSMSNLRLGYEYYLDSLKTISTDFGFIRHNDRLKSNISVISPSGDFRKLIESSPIEKELSAWIQFRHDRKEQGYSSVETGYTSFDLRNKRKLPGNEMEENRFMRNGALVIKAEWQKNLKKIKLLNGISAQLTRISDKVDTIAIAKQLISQFTNNSFTSYHEISISLKKWNLSLGANLDHISLELYQDKERFSYQETYLNPSLKVQKMNGNGRMSFSYNRKYILPGTHVLFGRYNQYEANRIAMGNYSLRPAVQDLMKISFTKTSKSTMLWEVYYDHMKNPFTNIYQLNGWTIIDRPENLDSRQSFGTVFSYSKPLSKFYSFTLNTEGRVNHHDLKKGQQVHQQKTWSASASMVNRFAVNKKLNLSLNLGVHNFRTTMYREMEPFVVYNLSGNYKASQKLNFSFAVNDLFNNMHFSYEGVVAPGFYESSYTRDRLRNVSLSVRYQLINAIQEKRGVKSFLSE